jgi:hypothetical protein
MIMPAASSFVATTLNPAERSTLDQIRRYLGARLAPIPATLGLLLLILSTVDAAATLVLLDAGCEEINPAMRLLLGHGPSAFLAGKLALTALGSLVLVVFEARPLFRSPVRVGHALAILVGLYAVLNVYQATLLIAI